MNSLLATQITGTHHVDISGEPLFLERVQLLYDEPARAKRVFIVGSCGFDSIPADCGLMYLKDERRDLRLNHVESFIKVIAPYGTSINHGTFDTLFESIRLYPELRIVRNQLFPKIFTRKFDYEYRLKGKSLTRGQPPLQNEWFVPVWKTDQSVVKRTQHMIYAQNAQDTPVQFEQYLNIFFQPWYMYLGLMFIFPITKLLLRFKATRSLIQKYPDFFTWGFFTKRCRGRTLLLRGRSFASTTANADYQYLERSSEPTDKYQSQLPLLPIPELHDTCSRYLDALRPLILDQAQFHDTERHVQNFERNCGKQLDHELRKRSADITDRSYFSDDWLETYLTHRSPLPIHMNPYYIMRDDPQPQMNLPALRATNLIISAMRYWRSLRDRVLAPEKIEMRPFQNIFSTTRIPRQQRDEVKYFEQSRHIVLLRHGQFYAFDVLDDKENLKSPEEIASFVHSINALPTPEPQSGTSICSFSADDRDSWAAAREHLESLTSENRESLQKIDSALLLVCLDSEPYDPTELSTQSLAFLHGCYRPENLAGSNGRFRLNRWFDKSIQLIITHRGVAGLNFEHSWADGVVLQSAFNKIYEDSVKNRFVKKLPSSIIDVSQNRLSFTLDERIRQDLETADRKFRQFAASVQMTVVEYEDMNRQYLKDRRISPDFVFQMAFQMANYKLFTHPAATYEACSTASFKLGRTETIRSATMETKKACNAMAWGEKKYSFPDLRRILQEASVRHKQLSRLASQGQGFDRHMFALRCLSRKLDMNTPAIFQDPSHKFAYDFTLSTSHLYGQHLIGGGYGPVIPDGFGLAYGFSDDGMNLNCTSFEGQSSDEFAQAFFESLQEINNVLERT